MSTDLMSYVNYMATWDSETDDHINTVINEQTLFASLGDFSADSAIDSEFDTLVDLATTVRDETIAADAIQIAADAAAVASIWSFGLSMAAFAALEAAKAIDEKVISDKTGDLNAKLQTVDVDIASKINPNVNLYVVQYKANNDLIASKAPIGLDVRTCRSILMQFLAHVRISSGKLDAPTFRQYAESARILFNSTEINGVYDALDKLNLSAKSNTDIQQYMSYINGLDFNSTTLSLLKNVSLAIMAYKLNIANSTIKECADAAGFDVAEVDSSAFGMLDAIGKFVTVVAVVMSVVDIVLSVLDIVDVVEQSNTMIGKLNGPIKDSYKQYFDGIHTASQQYNAAITPSAPTSKLMASKVSEASKQGGTVKVRELGKQGKVLRT